MNNNCKKDYVAEKINMFLPTTTTISKITFLFRLFKRMSISVLEIEEPTINLDSDNKLISAEHATKELKIEWSDTYESYVLRKNSRHFESIELLGYNMEVD